MVAIPCAEVALAVLALRRRTWPLLRWAAPALHLGITGVLVGDWWNQAVWPWNVALALVVPLLFAPESGGDLTPRPRPRPTRAAGLATTAVSAILVLEPAGFYAAVGHPYLQHNLYSSNTPTAQWCTDGGCVPGPDTFGSLDVPVPPWPHTYRAWFDLRCEPGDTLVVDGPDTRLGERTRHEQACPRPAS